MPVAVSGSASTVGRTVSSRRDHRAARRSSHPNPSFPPSVGTSHLRLGADNPRGGRQARAQALTPSSPPAHPGSGRHPAERRWFPPSSRPPPAGGAGSSGAGAARHGTARPGTARHGTARWWAITHAAWARVSGGPGGQGSGQAAVSPRPGLGGLWRERGPVGEAKNDCNGRNGSLLSSQVARPRGLCLRG